ncbi:MAG TPA: hypothetical protein PKA13_14895 [Geminicoccaceae bacterium]|nr:hypothetical protein [Geminicoccus sp.]HMU51060.1 hypothetical protein [Geminicoccaceae bacterium]
MIRPAVLAMGLLTASPALAQPAPQDPEWPCPQRLVPELALGQMWTGPQPPAAVHWASDPQVSPLALQLANSELPLEDATAKASGFARTQPEAARSERLALLFQGTLEIINGERSELIEGIRNYTRNQRALAAKINAESEGLVDLPVSPLEQVPEHLVALKRERDWDIRIFEDRAKSLKYLCDQPVLLEQRAFGLGRAMAGMLP